MFEKRAEYNLINIEALHAPEFMVKAASAADSFIENLIPNPESLQQVIDKIAISSKESSEEKSGDGEDSPAFDLQAEIDSHPDSLFIKCFAILADETNDNGDYFSRIELKKATPTFVGVPLFTNHANADINEARGKVVHSWWDEEQNGIMIVGRVDAEAYPQLARGIKEEYVVGTSMGCQVQYSICSVCHNYAETPDQYCSCIQERKTRMVQAKNQKCKYHERGDESECPICGSTKDEQKKYAVNTKVFEYNYGIKFIENSFVVNPACPTCGVTEIIDPHKFRTKVAAIEKVLPRLLKAAENHPLTCTDQACGVTEIIDPHKFRTKVAAIEKVLPRLLKAAGNHPLTCTDQGCIKISGQQELDNLNQALDMLSSVSQAMLNQKEQIDLEFLSDLVQVLADLQTVTDELTEQGYGRLQSPGQPPSQGENPEQAQQGPPGVTNTAEPLKPTPGGGSKIHSGPAGQVGNVTSPLANVKRLDLEKLAKNIICRDKHLVIPNVVIAQKEESTPDHSDLPEGDKVLKVAFSIS